MVISGLNPKMILFEESQNNFIYSNFTPCPIAQRLYFLDFLSKKGIARNFDQKCT